MWRIQHFFCLFVGRDKYAKKEGTIKLTMKGGAVVDPESELDEIGHILKVY